MINDKGQVVGIGTNFDAVICGGQDMGIVGAAVAINNLGQAVGYSNDQPMCFHQLTWGRRAWRPGSMITDG